LCHVAFPRNVMSSLPSISRSVTSALVIATMAIAVPTSENRQCDNNGIECIKIKANGFTFDCRKTVPTKTSDNPPVLFLHGFPEWANMYDDSMLALADKGYRSFACDQRGYSPNASPEGVEAYKYSKLADDVFEIAKSPEVDSEIFHLVAHDHGALLGWTMVSSNEPRSKRIVSFTAASIPHLDAFNEGLAGTASSARQQLQSQYFSMFVAEDSATKGNNLLYKIMGGPMLPGWGSWATPKSFEKPLFWYNGAVADGVLSIPDSVGADKLKAFESNGGLPLATMRKIWGGADATARKATKQIGTISIPTLYICGGNDPSVSCYEPYALKTKNYVSAEYTYVETKCGHGVFYGCKGAEGEEKAINAIVAHIIDVDRRSY
jgi:pimeloyl-ACP methyl ester carboxylesterase